MSQKHAYFPQDTACQVCGKDPGHPNHLRAALAAEVVSPDTITIGMEHFARLVEAKEAMDKRGATYMPTMDEVHRFMVSNPLTSREMLDEIAPKAEPVSVPDLREPRELARKLYVIFHNDNIFQIDSATKLIQQFLTDSVHAKAPERNFTCMARASNMGANDPQECNWPFCNCDPYADKVIAAIQESGFEIVQVPGVAKKRREGTEPPVDTKWASQSEPHPPASGNHVAAKANLSEVPSHTPKEVYCHACSEAGDGERAVYHAPPSCCPAARPERGTTK